MVKDGGVIKQVILSGKMINTDMVLFCPNNFQANTEIFDTSSYADEMKFDKEGRICTAMDLNVGFKRIYAAGECASVPNFTNGERLKYCSFADSITQGVFAGFNMSGMGIPYSVVPYQEFDFYSNKFRVVGAMNYFEQMVIDGDLDSLDFMAYYMNKGIGVMKAAGFVKQGKDMQVLREAMRVSLPIGGDPDAPTLFKKVNIASLEKKIRVILGNTENEKKRVLQGKNL